MPVRQRNIPGPEMEEPMDMEYSGPIPPEFAEMNKRLREQIDQMPQEARSHADFQFKQPVMPQIPEMPKAPSAMNFKPKAAQKTNPLQRYFRSPGIHVKLPSGGRFNNPGDLILTASGDLEVFPMTAADEIILKNPDSLLNGHAIEKVIHSCVPGVRNIRALPNQDVEVLLLAVKYSSFGDNMELNVKCPQCGEEHVLTLSVMYLIESASPLSDQYEYRLDDKMIFYLRPHTFESHTKASLAQFEETKIIKTLLAESDLNEAEKIKQFQLSFDRVAQFNLELLSNCIMGIAVPEGLVEDQEMIEQFILNADRRIVKLLQEEILKINSTGGVIKGVEVTCPACQNKWESSIVYDPANFFG